MEQIQVQEKELSLKDILILVKEYLREIRKSWFFAIPLILAVGGYYVYQHHKEGIKYPAGVTFMVNEEEGEDIGAGSGIGALLKSFTGKGGKDNGTGLEKVLQLFKSKSIIERAIFKKVKVDGVDDYVANHLINIYTLEKLFDEYSNDKWLEPIKNLKTYSFKSSNIDSFTNEEKLLLIVIYEAIAGNKLEGIDSMILPTLDDKSNIMNFGVTTNSEDLTIAILEGIYAELSDFYVKQTVQKQTKVYDIVKAKSDSLRGELANADEKLAKFEDSNRSLVWVTGELTKVKLQRQSRITEVMYAESVKQLEMADFALKRKIPYVNIIDFPRKPLRAVKMSILRSTLISLTVGTFLGILVIIIRKVIKDALSKVSFA